MSRNNKPYTAEQIKFLKDNIKGKTYREITILFNELFGLNKTKNQIGAMLSKYKIKNGLPFKAPKGCIPHNKGKKRWWKSKGFEKGHRPKHFKPVGSERFNTDHGYIDVKIAEPSVWKAKHAVIWEKANGKIPKGYVVIFADRNINNYDIENLLLVSRGELCKMATNYWISNDSEITKTGKNIAKLCLAISKRKRSEKPRCGSL